MEIISQNINQEEGHWGLVHETSKGMHSMMAPGPMLDRMNRTMLGAMEGYFNELASQGNITVGLYGWFRPRLTVASTGAIYGPGNPFKHRPEVAEDFW